MMSRTRLCVITATILAGLSVATIAARLHVLGPEVRLPHGPDTWKTTMLVQGKSAGDAWLITAVPLDGPRQHVVSEQCVGESFGTRPVDPPPGGGRRTVRWTQRPGAPSGPFRVHYVCYCTVAAAGSSDRRDAGPTRESGGTGFPPVVKPKPGEHLRTEPGIEADDSLIAACARDLTAGLERPADQAQALFRFVEHDIASEPSIAGVSLGAVECLKQGAGDSAAKSRLLAALCRNCGIPARLVTGLTLTKDDEQLPHVWVEAWLRDHWLSMCPYYHHFGHVPRTYLVFGYGDLRLVRGRNVSGLTCAFHVERLPANAAPVRDASWAHQLFTRLSLHSLPPAEQRLAEFLLLLPVAALVICIFRNVIGVASFGTFGPALIGLVFREMGSLLGVLVFAGLILVGWRCRRLLDRFHLLQVPRTALMLSLVVVMLIGLIAVASRYQFPVTRYVSLFPVIILTGMMERFWTLEEEDGARTSFRTLVGTLVIAAAVAVVVSAAWVSAVLAQYPESLGLVMAGQLLLGRYTGYRVAELYRFRDFVTSPDAEPNVQVIRRSMPFRRF
jgi:hypothetical protein